MSATPRIRPRNAASLVVLREDARGPSVLLGRRPPRDRFMPDVYVFPGGRVDRGDARAPATRELAAGVATALSRHAAPATGRGLAVAALRETWEETGLVFGEVRGAALHPDLSALEYLARAITPNGSPIRYHARFFCATAARATGELASNGELLELDWVPIDDALRLPLMDVTRSVLEEAAQRAAGRSEPGVPLIRYRSGRMQVDRQI